MWKYHNFFFFRKKKLHFTQSIFVFKYMFYKLLHYSCKTSLLFVKPIWWNNDGYFSRVKFATWKIYSLICNKQNTFLNNFKAESDIIDYTKKIFNIYDIILYSFNKFQLFHFDKKQLWSDIKFDVKNCSLINYRDHYF